MQQQEEGIGRGVKAISYDSELYSALETPTSKTKYVSDETDDSDKVRLEGGIREQIKMFRDDSVNDSFGYRLNDETDKCRHISYRQVGSITRFTAGEDFATFLHTPNRSHVYYGPELDNMEEFKHAPLEFDMWNALRMDFIIRKYMPGVHEPTHAFYFAHNQVSQNMVWSSQLSMEGFNWDMIDYSEYVILAMIGDVGKNTGLRLRCMRKKKVRKQDNTYAATMKAYYNCPYKSIFLLYGRSHIQNYVWELYKSRETRSDCDKVRDYHKFEMVMFCTMKGEYIDLNKSIDDLSNIVGSLHSPSSGRRLKKRMNQNPCNDP